VAAWLGLLALSVHQLVPPALAASWAAGDQTFVCHAGAPADTPVQSNDEFGCCGHCPLCQLPDATALVPPSPPGLWATVHLPVALLRRAVPADRRPGRTAASATPLHPRAPPVAV